MSYDARIGKILLHTAIQTGWHNGGKNIPFAISGPPGIAKTAGIKQLAKKIEKKLETAGPDFEHMKGPFPAEIIVAPQRLPEDIGGLPIPMIEEKEVMSLPMHVARALKTAGQGIFVIDEFTSASQAMGGACMTLVQDHLLGDIVLPEQVAMGACMNPPDHATNGRPLTAAESNRFLRIDWSLSFADWKDYQMGGEGVVSNPVLLPKDWEKTHRRQAFSFLCSYLSKNPAQFDAEKNLPQAQKAHDPWASPRSWENAGRMMAALMSLGYKPVSDVVNAALGGLVGEGSADAFTGWLTKLDLPDPEEVLAAKLDIAIKMLPERGDKLQVALEAVCNVAQQQEHENHKGRWEKAWKILGPVVQKQPDCALAAAKILAEPQPAGTKIPKEARLVYAVMKKAGITLPQ